MDMLFGSVRMDCLFSVKLPYCAHSFITAKGQGQPSSKGGVLNLGQAASCISGLSAIYTFSLPR